MNRRILAWLLVLVLAAGMIAAPASAAAVNGQTENWSYAYVEGGISLTAYHGNAETVTVPAVLGTNKVVAIAKGCFSGNTKLTEVDISHGIRVIGEEAFFGCEALKKVHISGSVNEIGARAFSHTALSSAEIPGKNQKYYKETVNIKKVLIGTKHAGLLYCAQSKNMVPYTQLIS